MQRQTARVLGLTPRYEAASFGESKSADETDSDLTGAAGPDMTAVQVRLGVSEKEGFTVVSPYSSSLLKVDDDSRLVL